MKRLLITTAIAALVAAPALAQSPAQPAPGTTDAGQTRTEGQAAPRADGDTAPRGSVVTGQGVGSTGSVAPRDQGGVNSGQSGMTRSSDMRIEPREGYRAVDSNMLSAEHMQDADVYDANDDSVASVSEVLLSTDGQIDKIIIDVGGFLGIGARQVAVDFEQLVLHQRDNDDDLRIYLPMTREQLEELPAYEG